MLDLRNVKKSYHVGGIETKALDGIDIAFRKKEFVAIVGASGSGKTTCLNIIGGLDRYDSGEMIIKGKKTSDFTESDWDAYRNNSVGFVFQNYNLITHLGIIANVELGMTLSGVSPAEKRRRALEVLEQVGLRDHLHKKPNQLSGGQMQRVAIARALANDPEILLCDEPTGALDTATSIQIMDLIKEVAKERLVVVVTHNSLIADKYADRIIRFQDGRVVSDSDPYHEAPKPDSFSLKKTSMSFMTALRLSFNNLKTKMGRALLTTFASSIGIIGIAVILSLSNGFQTQIDAFQRDALSEFPIIVTQTAVQVDAESIASMREEMRAEMMGTQEYVDSDEVYLYDPADTAIMHTNVLTDEYIGYLEAIDPKICSGIGYTRIVGMNLLRNVDGEIRPVALNNPLASMNSGGNMGGMGRMNGPESDGLSSYPKQLRAGEESYLVKNYELLAGEYPAGPTDLVLVVDPKNRVDFRILRNLGFDAAAAGEALPFSSIVGTEFRLISNDDYYATTLFGSYLPGRDWEAMYASDNSITLRISGVVRQRKDVKIGLLATGIAYSDELSQMVIDRAADSQIVKAQQASSRNVITMEEMDEETRNVFLSYLGGSSTPYMVMIYPDNFDDKEGVTAYLDAFNDGKRADDQIIYTDLAATISNMTGGIMTGITVVLIAFSSIALVVSLIMISIITYTSVLERTKEIGILRSLGARRRDITLVFDAETCILGVSAGIMGVVIAALLTVPINAILYRLTDLRGVAALRPEHAVMLVVISTVLTILGGHIPAKMASRKDAVEALRSE